MKQLILKVARTQIWLEMDTAMMKQTKFSVPLMVGAAAIHVLLKNFVNNASVSMKMARKILTHLLEMVTARMEQIMINVAMMEGIVVVNVSLPAIAQIALASKI